MKRLIVAVSASWAAFAAAPGKALADVALVPRPPDVNSPQLLVALLVGFVVVVVVLIAAVVLLVHFIRKSGRGADGKLPTVPPASAAPAPGNHEEPPR
jgi:hypothetical protein